MIDIKKLEEVHRLYPEGCLKIIPTFNHAGKFESLNYSMDIEGSMADCFMSLDSLISTIKHTKKLTTKYKVGQKLYCLSNYLGIAECEVLESSIYGNGEYLVQFHDTCRAIFTEDRLFHTKEQLINAQIDYWSCLKLEEISTRSDDMSTQSPSYTSEMAMKTPPGFEGEIIGFNSCNTCKKPMMDCDDNCQCPDKLIKSNNHSEDKLEKVKSCEKCGSGTFKDGLCWNLNCIDSCKHESDGKISASLPEFITQDKCKKCGDFYR